MGLANPLKSDKPVPPKEPKIERVRSNSRMLEDEFEIG